MWKLLMGAIAAALAVGVAGAGAGHEPAAVKSYTGCLDSAGGLVYYLKAGETPIWPCGPLTSRIHLGGGDITAVRAGAGLTGGSENGVATIALGGGFSLPQGCASGQVPKWTGTGWICAADEDTREVPETFAVFSAAVTIGHDEVKEVRVDCPDGSVVTGGGFFVGDAQIHLSEKSGNGWLAMASTGLFTTSATLRAHATCLRLK